MIKVMVTDELDFYKEYEDELDNDGIEPFEEAFMQGFIRDEW